MSNTEATAAAERRVVEAADAMVTYLLQKRLGQPADDLQNLQLAEELKSAADEYFRVISEVELPILARH